MHVMIKAIALFTVIGLTCFCATTFAGEKMDDQTLAQDNAAFAIDLYRKLRAPDGNLFFSPYSISTALAMTCAGARGDTEKQMAQTLRFSLPTQKLPAAFRDLGAALGRIEKTGDIQLSVANSLWPQQDYQFLDSYLSLVEKYYGAAVVALDYQRSSEAARRKINQWVEDRTRDKIKELIPPGLLNALTRLVLVNAIYFKGRWENQFEERLTRDANFHVSPRQSVRVPMMALKYKLGYAQVDTLQLLELPYAGGELSMLIVLPQGVDGLDRLENSLTLDDVGRWKTLLHKQEISVFLPRFKMTSMFRLDKTLASMGMTDAFGGSADFRGMDGRPGLSLSAVLHKAYIEVNEEGTEAAAATAVIIQRSAAPAPPKVFRADHPFMFLIQEHRTGSILFIGRLKDPAQGQDGS